LFFSSTTVLRNGIHPIPSTEDARAYGLLLDCYYSHIAAVIHTVQVRGAAKSHEKLGPIGVGPGVRQRQETGAVVGQQKVFVSKFCPVNAFAARAVAAGEVTPLSHEIGNDPVEETFRKRQFFAGARRRAEWKKGRKVAMEKESGLVKVG